MQTRSRRVLKVLRRPMRMKTKIKKRKKSYNLRKRKKRWKKKNLMT